MARLVCTPCAGRTTDETGSDATDDKAECTPHAALTECVAWPDGSASAVAGSNAIVDNEECTTTFCAANEHVVPTACVVCPAGSTSAGGDDASCNDSERCESTLSDARGRVLNNQSCAEGAAGGMSLATDDASKALYPAVDGCGAYYMQNDAGTAEDARKPTASSFDMAGMSASEAPGVTPDHLGIGPGHPGVRRLDDDESYVWSFTLKSDSSLGRSLGGAGGKQLTSWKDSKRSKKGQKHHNTGQLALVFEAGYGRSTVSVTRGLKPFFVENFDELEAVVRQLELCLEKTADPAVKQFLAAVNAHSKVASHRHLPTSRLTFELSDLSSFTEAQQHYVNTGSYGGSASVQPSASAQPTASSPASQTEDDVDGDLYLSEADAAEDRRAPDHGSYVDSRTNEDDETAAEVLALLCSGGGGRAPHTTSQLNSDEDDSTRPGGGTPITRARVQLSTWNAMDWRQQEEAVRNVQTRGAPGKKPKKEMPHGFDGEISQSTFGFKRKDMSSLLGHTDESMVVGATQVDYVQEHIKLLYERDLLQKEEERSLEERSSQLSEDQINEHDPNDANDTEWLEGSYTGYGCDEDFPDFDGSFSCSSEFTSDKSDAGAEVLPEFKALCSPPRCAAASSDEFGGGAPPSSAIAGAGSFGAPACAGSSLPGWLTDYDAIPLISHLQATLPNGNGSVSYRQPGVDDIAEDIALGVNTYSDALNPVDVVGGTRTSKPGSAIDGLNQSKDPAESLIPDAYKLAIQFQTAFDGEVYGKGRKLSAGDGEISLGPLSKSTSKAFDRYNNGEVDEATTAATTAGDGRKMENRVLAAIQKLDGKGDVNGNATIRMVSQAHMSELFDENRLQHIQTFGPDDQSRVDEEMRKVHAKNRKGSGNAGGYGLAVLVGAKVVLIVWILRVKYMAGDRSETGCPAFVNILAHFAESGLFSLTYSKKQRLAAVHDAASNQQQQRRRALPKAQQQKQKQPPASQAHAEVMREVRAQFGPAFNRLKKVPGTKMPYPGPQAPHQHAGPTASGLPNQGSQAPHLGPTASGWPNPGPQAPHAGPTASGWPNPGPQAQHLGPTASGWPNQGSQAPHLGPTASGWPNPGPQAQHLGPTASGLPYPGPQAPHLGPTASGLPNPGPQEQHLGPTASGWPYHSSYQESLLERVQRLVSEREARLLQESVNALVCEHADKKIEQEGKKIDQA
eukprot:gene13970-1158_t